jgi:hypothetical protein
LLAMRRHLAVLALPVVLASCASLAGGGPGPAMPTALQPVTAAQLSGWIAASQPAERRLLRFKWQFVDADKATAGGNGSARIAVPDSLRFDYRGPLGAGRGAAVVIGDSGLWAEPEEQFKKLVPNYALLWAMLGVVRSPSRQAVLFGLEDERITAWRYVHGADTVDYARTKGTPVQLVADVREGGTRIGRVVTTFDDLGAPATSRLDVPAGPVRLTLKFTMVSTPPTLAPEIWHAPRDN